MKAGMEGLMKQVGPKEQWRDSGKRGSGKKNMNMGVESGQACYIGGR